MWLLLAACTAQPHRHGSSFPVIGASHASGLALAGERLYAVNPDADSVSVVDVAARALVAEIGLADGPPTVDADGDYTPAVAPRSLALSVDGGTLFVVGQRSGRLYAVGAASGELLGSVVVGSEPVSVVVGGDGVFVACAAESTVVRVDPDRLAVTGVAAVPDKPWALAWSADRRTLLVTRLLGSSLAFVDPSTLSVRVLAGIPEVEARGDRRLAHGEVRGVYDLVATQGEVWAVHTLLATDTEQPDLDFESTVFPALSALGSDGAWEETLSTDAADVVGIDGAIADIVSGPRALAITRDGAYALVADQDSEDLLGIDLATREQAALLRPLPGHQPDAVLLATDEREAYVLERNTADIAVVTVDRDDDGLRLAVDAVIPLLGADPMPAQLRLGQHLFFSANSDELPITRNHWVACASCHLEGRSDAVTWQFEVGPRDTPSNAGGTRGTGFLLRTADRTRVQDYWETIDVEQGGQFDPVDQARLLDALAAFVDHALPLPVPPTTDPARVARGKALFESDAVGCAECHFGPRLTDSGDGNPTLDLAGPVLLHDVGTCADGDRAHAAIDGDPREACAFDTPSLSGLADSAPYLHDGSAATLDDVLARTRGTMGHTEDLTTEDLAALVEYLRSL